MTEEILGEDGESVTTHPDGTVVTVRRDPDARWGMQCYLLEDRPLLLERQRRQVPPRLAVYSTKLNHKARLEALGLRTEPFFQGVYRIRAPSP